ncbi:flagellar filament capping protein FliD [Hydrogenophaga sp.]|uniref:flagellar filament capping protein FliD n=1 Tax=Hydrogenophaga sp. TaxID=1904254 RepID=UPI003F71A148
MATISSPGIGSGLDVQNIVSQLVAIEKAPLKQLETQATSFKTKLSVYGTIKSQVSALGDAAAKLSTSAGWNAVTSTSSNPSAVSVTAAAGAAATGLTLEVQQLARAQSTASTAVPTDSAMGGGTMTISLGTWSGGAFTAGTGTPVNITINPGQDTLTAIAARINEAGAGVSATVLRDASGERLLMRSSTTGEANGFRIEVAESGGAGLSRLAYDGSGAGMTQTRAAQNALATINGVAVVSATNRMTDTLPGLTVQLSQVTTAPVEIDVSIDPEGARKNIQTFIDAYNALTKTLADATRYDPTSKSAGALQGDGTAVGLQNALRSMMRSVTASSPFERLADVGIEAKSGGELSLNATKFDAALTTNYEGLRQLFTVANANPTSQGFGLKIRTFAQGLIDSDGVVSARSEAIQNALTRNGKEQDKVNDRAARAEVRLLAQYNAMDANVGRLSGLNAFVTQQIALWNKSTA